MRGAGIGKHIAPRKTGNLRRSITFSGKDNFPDIYASEKNLIPERLKKDPLSPVRDTVWIGTNLIYAGTQERNFGYMQSAYDAITGGILQRSADFAIKEVMRRHDIS
jgi:hypothetical protein